MPICRYKHVRHIEYMPISAHVYTYTSSYANINISHLHVKWKMWFIDPPAGNYSVDQIELILKTVGIAGFVAAASKRGDSLISMLYVLHNKDEQ